jgi:hypothetical protein
MKCFIPYVRERTEPRHGRANNCASVELYHIGVMGADFANRVLSAMRKQCDGHDEKKKGRS